MKNDISKKTWTGLAMITMFILSIYFAVILPLMKESLSPERLQMMMTKGMIFYLIVNGMIAAFFGIRTAVMIVSGNREKVHAFIKRNKILLISMTVLMIMFMLITIISIFSVSGNQMKQKNAFRNSSMVVSDGDSFSYKDREIEQEKNSISMVFRMFYGVETFFAIEKELTNEVIIEYELNLSKGHCMIVLVNEKKEIIKITENSSQDEYLLDMDEGKYLVKVIGENASGVLKINISNR